MAVEPGGKSLLVTDMGDLKAMFAPDGSFWPLDSTEAKNLPPLGRLYRITLDGKVSVAILDEKNRQLIVPDSKAGLLVFMPLS